MKKIFISAYLIIGMAISSVAQQASTFPLLKKNAVKINLLSPIYGNLSISYQRLINPYKSVNVTLGYMDFDDYTRFDSYDKFRLQGGSLTIDYRTNLNGYGLNGAYIAPFVRYMYYQSTDTRVSYTSQAKVYATSEGELQSTGVGFILGKQYIIKNKAIIDLFAGPSYQILISNTRQGHTESNYLPSISDRYLSGYGIRAGITVGIIY